MSHKSVLQECPTRVSYKSVLQECPTRVSYKSVPEESPTRVSYKRRVPQECPTRVSFGHISFSNAFAFGFVGSILFIVFSPFFSRSVQRIVLTSKSSHKCRSGTKEKNKTNAKTKQLALLLHVHLLVLCFCVFTKKTMMVGHVWLPSLNISFLERNAEIKRSSRRRSAVPTQLSMEAGPRAKKKTNS